MSQNTEIIYSNQVIVGEEQGTPYMVGRNQKLNTETNIVAEDRTPVITFTDSSNTIDFHNKAIVNFTGGGGGGGGDAFLGGGTSNTTAQQWTGFNRFTNDLQLQDHLLFSDDGITEKAKISCAANEMKILTDTPTDIISMKLGNGGSTNTLELKRDPLATTQNGLFLRQNGSGSTLDKVLTNSTQDLGVIVDAVEASPNTFTNTNTFSTSTTTTGITNTGGLVNSNGMVNTDGMTTDVLTCQGLLTTQSLNATQNITGNQVLSNGNITCGVGSNFIVGSAQIASGNLSDVSSLLNTSATQQVKTGNLVVGQITSSAGVLNFDTTGGANIQNDTTNNVLLTSTTNATDSITWRLGTSGNDNLRLRYDANGGGVGVPRYFLEMLDPATGPSSYFQLTGNSTYDIASIIALLNNTSLTFNPTTTLSAQGTFVHIGANALLCGGGSNGTLNIGLSSSTDVVNIEASVNFDGTNTHTFGTNSTVLLNGTTTLASGATDIGKSGVIYGVFGQLESMTDRTLSAWEPTNTTITPVSGYINNITNLFVASFVRVRFGTNHFITMRGGFAPSSGTFPSGNFTIANMGSTYAPSSNMYFSYQKQPGVPPGMINLTPTGDFILIGLSGNETEVYLGGIQYFVD
jgi:hypothetical protein